jgi:hypothetical protein
MTPRAILSMTRACIRQRNERRAREQIHSLVDAAAKPVTVTWFDETHCEIVDADGITRAKCGEIEVTAKGRGR